VFVDLSFVIILDSFCSRRRNEQSCFHLQSTWAAPRCSCVAREDAGVSATRAAGEPSGHRCDVIVIVYFDVCDLKRSVQGDAMSNLASMYRALGRHQDALVLQEKTLEFYRRVQPENHPHIGVM
jgi:hypothetical protein